MIGDGLAFVVSGPSGVGKTTIVKGAIEADRRIAFSVSHTTRAPRAGEVDGKDYFFVDEPEFRRLVAADGFLEWAEYQGHLYGTSLEAVSGPTRAGSDVILEVEVQGARQLRERLPRSLSVFVLPPSMDVLERRLRGRASDSEAAIRKRIARAHEEVREASGYDYVIVNENVDGAIADLLHVVAAARLTRGRVVSRLRDRFDFGDLG